MTNTKNQKLTSNPKADTKTDIQNQKPLNVLLVTETWYPEVNGVARSVLQLVKGLVANGHHITLVRPKIQANDTQYSTNQLLNIDLLDNEIFVTSHKIPMYQDMQFGRPDFISLQKTLDDISPDVVHIVTEGPLGLAALMAARFNDVPVSSGYHSQFDDFSEHLVGYAHFVKPLTHYLNWFHNRCDLTCVPSQKSHQELTQAGVKNLHIVGRGVDATQFNPSHRSKELRATWGADDRTTVIIYVGRVSPEKNIDLTIDSFRALKKAQPKRQFKLVIVGDGPAKEALEKTTPDAIFTGVKTGEALSQHYASADCFVFASRVETFGNVVTEAMASGLTLVAFHDAAAARFVTEDCGWTLGLTDETGFVQTVADLPSKTILRKMGKKAHKKMANLGWQTPVEQFYQGFLTAQNNHVQGKHLYLNKLNQYLHIDGCLYQIDAFLQKTQIAEKINLTDKVNVSIKYATKCSTSVMNFFKNIKPKAIN